MWALDWCVIVTDAAYAAPSLRHGVWEYGKFGIFGIFRMDIFHSRRAFALFRYRIRNTEDRIRRRMKCCSIFFCIAKYMKNKDTKAAEMQD